MTPNTKQSLEAAGWTSASAEDFLELTPEERDMVDRLARMLQGTMSLEGQGLNEADLATIKGETARQLKGMR